MSTTAPRKRSRKKKAITMPRTPAATKSSKTADGVDVFCSHTKLMRVSELSKRRYPNNPNTHPEGQIKLLAKIIAANGWRNPIVVSKRSGLITKGHGRLDAAVEAGWDWAPVDIQEYESEDTERADVLADNRIAELAEPDIEILNEWLVEFPDNFDMDLTGYDAEILEAFEKTLAGEGGIDENDPLYTRDIGTVVYTPKGEKPKEGELLNRERADSLREEIEGTKLPAEVKEFLLHAAERHTVFQFDKIAEYYAHAPKRVQDLMEKSALVLIDYKKAMELGYMNLTEKMLAEVGIDTEEEGAE